MIRLSSAEEQVLATLSYCDQFDFPLTQEELWLRLISPTSEDPLTKESFLLTVKKLVTEKFIERKGLFFNLKGRSGLAEVRQFRQQASQNKQSEVSQVVGFLRKLPWIKAVFVTGSLAMMNAEPENDADFFIACQPNRLWLTRVLVMVFAQQLGKRRSWNGEEVGSWCFNLWLDTHHLSVVLNKRRIYQAYEVIQAQPAFSRDGTAELFFQQNSWTQRFLPNWPGGKLHQELVDSKGQIPLIGEFLDFIDLVCWKAQRHYMQPHRTSEKVGRGFAFFHPRDTAQLIYAGWQKSLERVVSANDAATILKSYV